MDPLKRRSLLRIAGLNSRLIAVRDAVKSGREEAVAPGYTAPDGPGALGPETGEPTAHLRAPLRSRA